MVLLVDNVVGSLNPGFFPALILEVSKLVVGMKNWKKDMNWLVKVHR
jgi:hypothetical protein